MIVVFQPAFFRGYVRFFGEFHTYYERFHDVLHFISVQLIPEAEWMPLCPDFPVSMGAVAPDPEPSNGNASTTEGQTYLGLIFHHQICYGGAGCDS